MPAVVAILPPRPAPNSEAVVMWFLSMNLITSAASSSGSIDSLWSLPKEFL